MSDFDQENYEEPWPEFQGKQMAHHALSLLALVEKSDTWKMSENLAKFSAIVPNLLSCTIRESLDRFVCWGMAQAFWKSFSECHPDASKLVTRLYHNDCRPEEFIDSLFEDGTFDFSPIKQMVGEVFTHLYVPSKYNLGISITIVNVFYPVTNPGGIQPHPIAPEAIPEPAESAVNDLIAQCAASDPWGQRRRELLEQLIYLRDGRRCPLTGCTFRGFGKYTGVPATLWYIIPKFIGSNSKTEPLEMIRLFAGKQVAELVRAELNSIGNVITLYTGIAVIVDELQFGIEAVEKDDEVRYYFRLPPEAELDPIHPYSVEPDGRIPFGAGPYGNRFGRGPNAKLCNLHWAILKVMHMSGALAVFRKERDEQLENPSVVSSVHYIDAHLDKFEMKRGIAFDA